MVCSFGVLGQLRMIQNSQCSSGKKSSCCVLLWEGGKTTLSAAWELLLLCRNSLKGKPLDCAAESKLLFCKCDEGLRGVLVREGGQRSRKSAEYSDPVSPCGAEHGKDGTLEDIPAFPCAGA